MPGPPPAKRPPARGGASPREAPSMPPANGGQMLFVKVVPWDHRGRYCSWGGRCCRWRPRAPWRLSGSFSVTTRISGTTSTRARCCRSRPRWPPGWPPPRACSPTTTDAGRRTRPSGRYSQPASSSSPWSTSRGWPPRCSSRESYERHRWRPAGRTGRGSSTQEGESYGSCHRQQSTGFGLQVYDRRVVEAFLLPVAEEHER